MRVSEIARAAGIAPSAVRFYEAAGVLPPAPRSANGYRRYGDADLARIRLVVSLRKLGVEPAEAGRLAELCVSGRCDVMGHDLATIVAERRADVARRRAELETLDAELRALERTIAGDAAPEVLCCADGAE
jgi:DNA-binding transcriptional MerR regulator